MLKQGIIEPSTSSWSSPVVLVEKKDGSSRFCLDFRKLNNVTVKDAYPLPNAEELIDELSGSRWFSTLDLASGYWQVELDPIDREKTAFTFHGKGLFHFKVMCFGLTNAPATFQRLMESVLKGILWKICVVYMDDVICYADKFQTAYNNLKPKLSSGWDGIPSSILKHLPKNVIFILSHIFNQSLSQGEFISCFKHSKVITLFKKGCPKDVSNYRPISLLSCFSKIIEKLVYIRLSVQFSFFYFCPPHEQNNKMLKSLCVVKDGVRKRKKQQNELTLCLANSRTKT